MEDDLKESRKRKLRGTGKKSYRQRLDSLSSTTSNESDELSRKKTKSTSAAKSEPEKIIAESSNLADATAANEFASSPSASSTSPSSNRQLSSLIDFFPDLEAPRRLTRSLTRKLRASVGGSLFGSSSTIASSSNTTGCGISSRSQVGVQADGGEAACSGKEKKEAAANNMDKQLHDSTTPKETPSKNVQSNQTSFRTDHNSDRDFASSSSDSLDSSGRLHHLLESHRSIPIHIFGALGPRMQTFLSRCPSQSNPTGNSGGGGGRWDSLLTAMQKHDDLSAQLQGLIELCNLLVMSNEETLGPGFPVKDMVRCLIRLLQTEHNFDIMTHACRALTYLMEALPRVTVHVTDAVPYLLEKLQRVECIDVAEQALAALELLSRRHGKNILNAGGISACLQYIDFFSMSSQRSALQIVANCCLHMTNEDFIFLSDSLSSLSQRLTSQDKKTVELICLIFTRLVENYLQECDKLKRICDYGLLENVQQMIIMSPPILTSSTLCSVIRMLHLLCRQCSELAVRLLHLNVVAALRFLLLGTVDPNATGIELLARTPQELYELVLLVGELWPPLPTDGLFEVDAWLKPSSFTNEHILWTWKDEKGLWRPYMHVDNRILEAAFQSKEEEISLSTLGQTFTVDLVNMIQVNEETGHSQPIQRRVASSHSPSSKKPGKQLVSAPSVGANGIDPRLELLSSNPKLFSEFMTTLFPVLYEIYTSIGGPAVRHECLRSLLRMIYHCDADLMKDILKKHSISSLVAGMLNSQDLKTVVPALQLARVLIDKQPEIFTLHFKREGVTHQLQKLSVGNIQLTMSSAASSLVSSSYLPISSNHSSTYSPADLTYHPPHAVPVPVSGLNSLTSLSSASILTNSTLSSASFTGAVPKRPPAIESMMNSNRVSPSAKKRGVTSSSVNMSHKHTMFSGGSERLRPLRSRGRAASADVSGGPLDGKSATLGSSSSGLSNSANTVTSSTSGSGSLMGGGLLANLSLPRWVRPGAFARQTSAPTKPPPPPQPTTVANTSPMAHSVASNSFLATKTVSWVKDQAKTIIGKHFGSSSGGDTNDDDAVLKKMTEISTSLRQGEIECLDDLASLFLTDVSCFEILQSSLIRSLMEFLTNDSLPSHITRNERIRRFCEAFFAIEVKNYLSFGKGTSHLLRRSAINLIGGEPLPFICVHLMKLIDNGVLSEDKMGKNEENVPCVVFKADNSVAKQLVQKLNACVTQLEQLPVKVHDFGWGQTGSALRGLNALRFLHTQQIKCLLVRHPEEKSLRQWRKGPIKVDPLAQVSTIERYLITRGYGRPKSSSNEEICSEEDDDSSGDDSDEATVRQAFMNDLSEGQHRLQLSINDKVLPYDLTIYQAVRQFGVRLTTSFGEALGSPDWLGPEIWVNTHTLWYRLVNDKLPADSAGDKVKQHNSGKNRAKDKAHLKPVLDPKDIEVKPPSDPLIPYLQSKLHIDVADPSLESINLLRILFGMSRYWWTNFKDVIIPNYEPILPITEFHNAKVAGKIGRQLQDPLTLIAGQLPSWVEQLTLACPFLCPFEVRMAMFHVLALDRDRALQRLLDNVFDTGHPGGSERVTPRLERRKVIISRDDILRQAETVLSNTENSRAVLEVQYENEVGTGLGPTLEFYALVSRQLQKASLQLWRGDVVQQKKENEDVESLDEFIVSQRGLYPLALGRHVKQTQLDKMKTKFKLIGKLLGRSLLDGRILDLPLSPVLYKWLLKEENSLHLADLSDIDVGLFKSLQYLCGQLLKSQCGDKEYLEAKKAVEGSDLDFTFPGNLTVELTKGGKDTLVTLENLQQYVDLVLHWLLRAGVHRQMETMRDAFDSILPLRHLKLFLPEEMDQLFCGARSDIEFWDPSMLRQAIHPDHGYTHDSPQIHWLVQVLSQYDETHRRLFLQFITGSPRLPVGGLKNLNPPLTAVRKHEGGSGGNPDTHLPSVMTCVNYLKLPEYSSQELLAHRLLTAITCGCFSFHLS